MNTNEAFSMKRSFGLGVLLKLTKKNTRDIEISTDGRYFTSNVPVSRLSRAVEQTLETHRIRLKIQEG